MKIEKLWKESVKHNIKDKVNMKFFFVKSYSLMIYRENKYEMILYNIKF